MTAVLGTSVVTALEPTVAPSTDAPLSAQAADYTRLIASGLTPVDVRSQRKRQLDGVLSGALAIDAIDVLTRLTPGHADSLRSATPGARWLLISDDGHEAEWLAWHLQARGVTGAVFVVGGFRALRRARVAGRISEQELASISAH
ncbi:rhodanese-like domain-containing protein [Gordonia sp. ABSL11-1]|uniref:rhodanese-like domain-containing protein n=1 Tax=Gordonia sp. ABSL11-1 TaxID=3053924 RepID=UPI002574049F|nr:rhodanese-like domain-containing protein [Gordonia sp. ABSL11-1]MDL9945276.1 rhodanese-like domain-containing protein [Gordonia sp. ABSL11-1]